MSDLTTINNTLKEQNKLLKGNRAQELENIREQARKDAEMLKILSNLKPNVNIDGKESGDSFLMSVLKGFGLIGAGVAGLTAGLLEGWLSFVTTLIGKVGKYLFKLIDKIPRPKWLDDFLAAFKKEGKIGKIFTSIKNFFIGEASIFKRIGRLVDSAVDGVKNFTGGIFGKIKNFFVGEASIFKRIGTLVDTAVDGVKSFTGGIFGKIKNFFTADTSIFKRIAKILDPIIDSVKGFSGGIFTKIGNFFTGETSIFKRMKTAIDPVIDIVKGMSGGIFTKIGNVFQSIKNFASTLMSPFKVIGDLLGMGGDAAKATKGGGGIVKTIMGFLSPMKGVFRGMASLGRILGAPLTIIMGLIDAGFETKDAVEKSEGFFASILNGIFGAIGGFIDGAIMQVADLLKDGISWIAGFFGFKEVEKTLDSFSFSEIFNKFLDGVYEFVNKLFNNPLEMLRGVANSILGETITNKLFGASPEAQAAELKKQFEEQRKELSEMKQKTSVTGAKTGIGAESDSAFKKRVSAETREMNILKGKMDELTEKYGKDVFKKIPEKAVGGMIPSAGIYNLHQGEMVLDNAAVKGFEKALNLVNMSQQNAAAAGSGAPVIINNNTVDNSVRSNSQQNLLATASVRSGTQMYGA